ncbi:hypothetical protein RHOFW104T7_15645 [Rhodanobacter thiooxydans]|uniref:Uncharacterized protein n=1 Tax=Rhodanobacter thiooxydans TaxID=416169 RepID=A0A154QFR8_9GAMM|nr:hypothetical protein [Rhodanobacter thiooxydans]EIL96890.1 hypothetical protein UUA_16628 [Rhodanobacter thiooxydans LCS2]KZC23132.1 hypothetical protein RHOFW104T7_15645 [Rhodanobacter thiooxydans]MCW0201114.1 hypothetical protein [Rhodanobacter thiooxydans]
MKQKSVPLAAAMSVALLSLGGLAACSSPTSSNHTAPQAAVSSSTAAAKSATANPCAPKAAANPCAPKAEVKP